MHPFKSQASSSNKSKMSSLHSKGKGSLPNVSMRGPYDHVAKSSSSMQHKDQQSAVPGMARGGRTKSKSKKPKMKDMAAAALPSADAMMGAGASSPTPAPMPPPGVPGMPMQKRGGAVHSDVKEDKALIKKMVKPASIKKASGGSVSYPLTKGGADSGVGRLEYSKKHKS